MQTRASDIIQMLLFGAVVRALADEFKAKQVAIVFQTVVCIRHDNGAVVDAEIEFIVILLPARIALAGWEINDFQIMSIGIFKIESANAGGGFIADGDRLRAGGDVTDFGAAKLLICPIHVGYNDGYMLKAMIVAAPARRNRPSFRRQILCQLDYFFAELKAHHPHAQSEQPL